MPSRYYARPCVAHRANTNLSPGHRLAAALMEAEHTVWTCANEQCRLVWLIPIQHGRQLASQGLRDANTGGCLLPVIS